MKYSKIKYKVLLNGAFNWKGRNANKRVPCIEFTYAPSFLITLNLTLKLV
jgi:hypothetical protein